MNNFSHIITGVNGFLGSNLSSFFLKKGELITGVSRNPKKNELTYDQLFSNSFKSHTSFIHLAGKAHDITTKSLQNEYFLVNTELTKKVFNCFLKSDCSVFIYLSSVKAVCDEFDGIITESIVANPTSIYGKSKLAAEKYILSKNNIRNKRVFILRPSMIHGYKNKGNLNSLFQIIKSGIPWILGAYSNKRSFCSVDNLIFVINEIIQNKNIPSGIYNVSDNDALSVNEVVKLIYESQSQNPKIWNVPKKIIDIISKIGDLIYLPLNSEKLKKLTQPFIVSNKKIVKAINKPFPISAKEGMIKTFSYLKNK